MNEATVAGCIMLAANIETVYVTKEIMLDILDYELFIEESFDTATTKVTLRKIK
jgi:hypothetical protein